MTSDWNSRRRFFITLNLLSVKVVHNFDFLSTSPKDAVGAWATSLTYALWGIPDAKGNQNTKVCFQQGAGIIRLLDFNSLNQLRPLIPNVVHRSENGVPCEMISRYRTICNYLIHLFSSNSLPHPFPGGFRCQDQRPALWGLAVCKYKINSVG